EMVNQWRTISPKLAPLPTRVVEDGPVRQNIHSGDAVDISAFPVPLWHEQDGGRYFGTGDLVITRDVEAGWVNCGVYRSQLHDERTLGLLIAPNHHGYMHMQKYWARGEAAPVA